MKVRHKTSRQVLEVIEESPGFYILEGGEVARTAVSKLYYEPLPAKRWQDVTFECNGGGTMTNLVVGRDLDALIAEKVMGWAFETREDGDIIAKRSNGTFVYVLNKQTPPLQWSPSHNIWDAWEVVEKLRMTHGFALVDMAYPRTDWKADFATGVVVAATAPLAICLAALKAVGVEVPNGV